MDEDLLAQRLAQVVNGERVDMKVCEQTFHDSLQSRRLIGVFKEGGMAAVRQEAALYAWVKREYEKDPQCLSFKLWLAITNR